MARHRRSKSRSKNPRRSTRRGSGGWIKRHGKWVKGALARGGRKGRSHRAGRKGRSSRGRRHGRSHARRNPSTSRFKDGTTVSISGNSVTLHTPYGESYDYSEVSAAGIRSLYSARNLAAARKALNRTGILSSINPKRGRKSRRSSRGRTRRNCGRY